jgi:multidrug transporter EmrE-like cation transporter
MNNLFFGVLYGLFGQIGSFLQLQGNVKYGWYEKHPYILLLVSIPISCLYIQSVKSLVLYFGGEIWQSRFIGFGIGIIVFSIMSSLLFKEPFTIKTLISILLAIIIILIQIIK